MVTSFRRGFRRHGIPAGVLTDIQSGWAAFELICRPAGKFKRLREVAWKAEGIRRAGWDVIGDVTDLVPPEKPRADVRHPDDVSLPELFQLSLQLNAALLTGVRDEALRIS